MTQISDSRMYELAALQNIVNASMDERMRFLREHPELRTAPRRYSRRDRLGWRIRHLRQRLALRIAPWLDEY